MKPALSIDLLAVLLLAAGCAAVSAPDLRETNAENLRKLRPGMTRQEVVDLMGVRTETVQEEVVFELHLASYLDLQVSNPYKTEQLEAGDADFDILYYYAEAGGIRMGFWDRSFRERRVPERFLTPVVLKNGRVVGWGWEVLVEEGLKEPATALRQDESLLTGS